MRAEDPRTGGCWALQALPDLYSTPEETPKTLGRPSSARPGFEAMVFITPPKIRSSQRNAPEVAEFCLPTADAEWEGAMQRLLESPKPKFKLPEGGWWCPLCRNYNFCGRPSRVTPCRPHEVQPLRRAQDQAQSRRLGLSQLRQPQLLISASVQPVQ